MQPLAKLLVGLTLVCFGGLALPVNLNSLGWQRHGASLFDFSFCIWIGSCSPNATIGQRMCLA